MLWNCSGNLRMQQTICIEFALLQIKIVQSACDLCYENEIPSFLPNMAFSIDEAILLVHSQGAVCMDFIRNFFALFEYCIHYFHSVSFCFKNGIWNVYWIRCEFFLPKSDCNCSAHHSQYCVISPEKYSQFVWCSGCIHPSIIVCSFCWAKKSNLVRFGQKNINEAHSIQMPNSVRFSIWIFQYFPDEIQREIRIDVQYRISKCKLHNSVHYSKGKNMQFTLNRASHQRQKLEWNWHDFSFFVCWQPQKLFTSNQYRHFCIVSSRQVSWSEFEWIRTFGKSNRRLIQMR